MQETPPKGATAAPDPQKKKVALALQGGGAHGAFTWGVVDKLLEDGRIEIAGVSGASAGAMNATVLAHGLRTGGADKARKDMADYWQSVAGISRFMPASPMSALHIAGNPMAEFLSGQVAMEMLGHVISPNDSPFTKENPLEKLIDEKVDFEGLRKDPKVPLFVSATDARSGDLKLFSGDELSPKAVAASACLPNVFRSVNIDGRDYWDGGFMGNPPLQPLIQNTKADDVMLIQLNPVELKETPKSAPDINNRLKQLGFHSALLTEIRSVEMMNDLVDSGAVLPGMGVRKVHMHRIDGGEDLARMSAASKIFPDWTVSKNLFEQGRKAADQWLKTNFEKLGKESSFRQSPKNSFGVQQPASSNANTPAGNTTPVAMPAPPPTIRKLQKLATMQQHAANGKTK